MDKYSHSYDYSIMAVELLASYKGDGAILDYWASLDPGTVWETQFRKAFGISVDEFYTRFDEHAEAGFPTLETDADVCPSAARDRIALAALYNAAGGTDWREDANWLTDAPICQWHGVFTDADGRVTLMDLSGNGLTGTIPSALGELTSLRYLSLSKNNLSGPIPSELGRLSNLEKLRLWSNQLTGPIPSELGNLSSLTEMDLGRNRLNEEVPPELGNLTNLARLELRGNNLSGEIPAELGGLGRLEWMSISGNRLNGEIPPELGNLTNLEHLDLRRNRLSGELPVELLNLSNLSKLELEGNPLTGCMPRGLRDVHKNDLDNLSLPDCA